MKNCRKNTLKSRKGITLIALVVTIIVLLILAGISISMLSGDNSILQKAAQAKEKTERAEIIETAQMDILGVQAQNHGTISESELEEILTSNDYNTKGTLSNNGEASVLEKTLTSSDGKYQILVSEIYNGALKTNGNDEPVTEYVGCYADINDDGTIDGVIYADMAVGKSGTGVWGNYTVPKISGTKEYYVSQTNYVGKFGTMDVVAPVDGTSGNDRFYMMDLSPVGGDENPDIFYWYYKAAGNLDYDANTSTNFGTGKSNTNYMHNNYGTDDYPDASDADCSDVWEGIDSDITNGWFLPSRDEMVAFLNEFSITGSTYPNLIKDGYMNYLTSSTCNGTGAWFCYNYESDDPYLDQGMMGDRNGYAWLSKTF